MKLGERIRAQRKRAGMTQDEVAAALETSKQAIYKYEKGVVENIPFEKLERLAALFGVTSAYLLGFTDDPQSVSADPSAADELPLSAIVQAQLRPISAVSLPMLGNVACGEPIFAAAETGLYAESDGHIGADFCLRARGDSMINARIFDGDILFVRKQDIVDDGEIAVVLIDDEATVKRVYYDRDNSILTLIPENPLYRPMRYVGSQLDSIRILGKVVAAQYQVQ